jgi:hypothetical protein
VLAAVVTRFGGPEVLETREVPDPVTGPRRGRDRPHAAIERREVFGKTLLLP